MSYAVPVKQTTATLADYLSQEKIHLVTAIQNEKQSPIPVDEKQYQEQLQNSTALLAMTRSKIGSLQGFLDNRNSQQDYLDQRLKHLQQLPPAKSQISIPDRVAKVEALIQQNEKTVILINENLGLANDYQSALLNKLNELQLWKANFDLEQKIINIRTTKKLLNLELSKLYQQNLKSDTNSRSNKKPINPMLHEANLFISNQQVALIHHQLTTLTTQKKVVMSNLLLLKNTDPKTLQLVTDTYKNAINQYVIGENSLQQMLVSLKNQEPFIKASGLKKSGDALQLKIVELQKEDSLQKAILINKLDEYQTQLKKIISTRQSLSEYNINGWPIILHKVMDIPRLFYKYTKTLALKVYESYRWLDSLQTLFLWISLSLTVLICLVLNRFFKSLASDKERSRLTGYLYDGVLTLIQRNIPYFCLFAMMLLSLYFTNISYANYQLLFNLIMVWFTFRILILIARLVLLERISDSSGKDVKLYYRLKWLFLFGGWTTAMMVFSHVLPLSLLLQDIFNRLFMLFILTVSLVTWKSKDVIPYLLRPFLKGKKRYFKNAISLLVVLVPITLFTTALFGLFGFFNLAWTMSLYQAYILIVLVGYILTRGLIFDALELFSEWMITFLKNGWLWIEVFLKPIDGILRILLLLASVSILFQLFGWHSDSLVIMSIEKLSQYSIVSLPGIHITVASLVMFIFLLAVFVWAAKWSREFGYRWLFRNAKDVGIRNSLAVFTQYAVVLVGSIITLHALGLDFTGMSMILGGLAVGMGFGLRDFASNIVGGIMLLIERPVREGDLITIGEYEGQVAHIGIRSMRVSSWDNTQVLIPNAETFNKPFTNWTHQDGIVRTVIPIKVSRADEPLMIQQLILDVLAIIPEIVPDPPAQVFLKNIDAALVEFEVRYFINVQDHNRVEIRSKVLFAITAQFKAAGIRPPIEPITVELRENHGDFQSKNKPTAD